jgi:acetylornithine deacetylase
MTEATSARLLHQIDHDRQEIIAFEQELIRRPSETGNEKACQEFLADWLRNAGYTLDVFTPDEVSAGKDFRGRPLAVDYSQRPNVVAFHEGTGGGRSLLVMSHVDTVPVGPLEHWTVAPTGGEVREGKIYGRGAQDDKEGIVAQTFALECIRRAGLRLKGDVTLCSVVDEEGGGSMGSWACMARGYRAEAGIYCDGLEQKVHPANLGWSGALIHLKGRAGQMNISDVKRGAEAVYADLVAYSDERRAAFENHPLYRQTDWPANNIIIPYFNVGHPAAVAMNQATIAANVYTLPGNTIQADRLALEARVGQTWQVLNPAAPRADIQWNATWVDPYEAAVDEPIIATMRQASEEATGVAMPIEGMPASDLHILGLYSDGMPSVCTGPGAFGVPESAHQPNESISIDGMLMPFIKSIALTMLTWCGGATQTEQGDLGPGHSLRKARPNH